MNLNKLKNLELPIEALPRYRHQQADKYLEAGLKLLQTAQTQDFDHSASLQEAMPLLLDALRYRRRDLRCHLALAYLFSLKKMDDTSQMFMQRASDLAPAQPMIAELYWLFADKDEQALLQSDFAPPSQALKPAEIKELSARLESDIVATVLKVMRHPQCQLEPDASFERARIFQMAISEIRSLYQQMEQRLQSLAPHLAVGELCQRLQPLKSQLQRLKGKLMQCCEYRLMQAQMEVSLQACQRLNQMFSHHLYAQSLQIEIDVLLDDCDTFAQQLEKLNTTSGKTSKLMGIYRILVEQVTDLIERQSLHALKQENQAIAKRA